MHEGKVSSCCNYVVITWLRSQKTLYPHLHLKLNWNQLRVKKLPKMMLDNDYILVVDCYLGMCSTLTRPRKVIILLYSLDKGGPNSGTAALVLCGRKQSNAQYPH